MEDNTVMGLVERGVEIAAYAVDLLGILIILLGFVVGMAGFVTILFKSHGTREGYEAIQHARFRLGTYLLFGLELLIISDILRSVVARSVEDLIMLAVLVVIRTVIAVFLGREIEQIAAEGEGSVS